MDWTIQDLGAIGEFVGAIVVVVTLVYLVFQIRQNTLSIRSQSRYHVLEAINSDMRQVQNPEYSSLSRTIAHGDDVSNADRNRWAMTLTGWLSHQEMLFFEVTDGTLPRDFEETLRFRVAGTLLMPNVRETWETWRGLYTKGFQEYVDGF